MTKKEEGVSLPTLVQFGNRLDHLTGHIEAANEWAAEKFRNHPGLSSISIDIGAALIVQFSVVLTWNRQPLG